MRPPSSLEHPAEAKGYATKASSAFALIVTVMISALCAVQCGDVAAVPRRVDHDLVDHDVLGQAGDVANEIADILRLRHLRALFLGYRHRPLVEDRRRYFARQDGAGPNAVDALLHVERVAHRHHT